MSTTSCPATCCWLVVNPEQTEAQNKVLINTINTKKTEHTFAILPCCVPGQAKEGRKEYDRGGHSSISEPHLISAMPLLGFSVSEPGAAAASHGSSLTAFGM